MTEKKINRENDLETSEEDVQTEQKTSEAERRIKELSEKVELTSKDRDEKDALIKERDDKIAYLEKEKEFSDSFSDVLEKYPNAKTFKDAIKERVDKGYSVEDATFAVLGKEGKLGVREMDVDTPAGGSADTSISTDTEKPVSDMTQDERRRILEKELVLE